MSEILYPVFIAPVLRGAAGKPREEMLPVVEENGVVTAQMSRSFAHDGAKALHPVVHLQVIDRFGRIFLQKRSAAKKLLPGYWDTAVGGHVTYGESVMEALFREAREEIGLSDFNPIDMDSYVWESDTEREWGNVYAAVGNFDLHPVNDEVDEGRYWTPEEISAALGKGILTPNFENEYQRIGSALQALL